MFEAAKERWQPIYEEYGPAILMAAGSCCFASMDACAKALIDIHEIPAASVLLIRMSMTAIIAAGFMYKTGIPDPLLGPKDTRLWLVARGIFGGTGVLGMYSAIHWLPLNETLSIWFLSPILTGILASLFLAEPYTNAEILAGITSLLGVIFVTKPFGAIFGEAAAGIGNDDALAGTGKPSYRFLGFGEAFFSTIAGAICFVILRQIGERVHPLHSVYFFGAFTAIIMVGVLIFCPEQRLDLSVLTALDYTMLTMLSLFGWFATYLTNMAVQIGKAARTSLFVYIQLPLIMIYSYIFFDDVMDLLGLLGCLLIVGSAVGTTLTKDQSKSAQATTTSKEGADYASLEAGPDSPLIRGDGVGDHEEEIELQQASDPRSRQRV